MEIKISPRIMVDITCDCGERFLIPADKLLAGEIIPCHCGRATELDAEHINTAESLARMLFTGLCVATGARPLMLPVPHRLVADR